MVKKKSDGKAKKVQTAAKVADTAKKVKNTYYSVKKFTKWAAIVAAVFGLSFGGSFFRKPDSALSTFSYEIYDIVVDTFSSFDNLKYGVPRKTDRIINREGYAIGYSYAHKQPLWVSYILTAAEVKNKKTSRIDDFRSDWRLFGQSAQADDYKNSSYDRGHLAPAADMAWSSKTMSQSFFMSNMSPQHPSLNRGDWKDLEEKVRDWAVAHNSVCVISGPVFYNANKKYIGHSRVTVPDAYYKVVYAPEAGKMIGFILPNKDVKSDLSCYAVSVYDVEDAAQLEFFMKVSPDVRKKLKNEIDTDFWHL